MKAIKFVILAAGVLGLISFFLPYFSLKLDDNTTIKPSAMQVMSGLEVAKKGAEEIQKNVEDSADQLDEEGHTKLKEGLGAAKDAIDLIKGIIAIMFAPALVLLIIGGVGAARGKLERLGGIFALVISLIGLGTNGLAMAGLSSKDVKEAGMAPGIALYMMVFISTVGFVCGLLTIIKPDRGGRFA